MLSWSIAANCLMKAQPALAYCSPGPLCIPVQGLLCAPLGMSTKCTQLSFCSRRPWVSLQSQLLSCSDALMWSESAVQAAQAALYKLQAACRVLRPDSSYRWT